MHLISIRTDGGTDQIINVERLRSATFWGPTFNSVALLSLDLGQAEATVLQGPPAEAVQALLQSWCAKARGKGGGRPKSAADALQEVSDKKAEFGPWGGKPW